MLNVYLLIPSVYLHSTFTLATIEQPVTSTLLVEISYVWQVHDLQAIDNS